MIYDLRFTIYGLRLLVAVVIGFGVTAFAQGQPAEEYFHGGAQLYLSNNIPAALETVTNGLQRFPQDEKLKKLYELLNQQQQQNQQDQKDQKQDKQDDQKQDQKKQDDKKDQQSKSDEQKKKDQEKKDQQQKSADKSKDKPEDKKEDAQPIEAHAMTPQEAKQLLDAQKGDEQVLMFKPEIDPKRQEKKLKDW